MLFRAMISQSVSKRFFTGLININNILFQSWGKYNVSGYCRYFNHSYGVMLRHKKSLNLYLSNSSFGKAAFSDASNKKFFRFLLMNSAPLLCPNPLKYLKSRVFLYLIMNKKFDNSFDVSEFMRHAREVLFIVTDMLSKENFSHLKDVITPKCLTEVQHNINNSSAADKSEIAVKEEDLHFNLIYDAGIAEFDEEAPADKENLVEIVMTFYAVRSMYKILHGYDELKVYNITFMRDYSKFADSHWIIKAINLFYLENAVPPLQ